MGRHGDGAGVRRTMSLVSLLQEVEAVRGKRGCGKCLELLIRFCGHVMLHNFSRRLRCDDTMSGDRAQGMPASPHASSAALYRQ